MQRALKTEDGRLLERDLNQSASELMSVLSDFTAERRTERTGGEGWSVLEIVEHVTVVDRLFSRSIRDSVLHPEALTDSAREKLIFEQLSIRGTRLSSPEIALPKGKFKTTTDALKAFTDVREKLLDLLCSREAELRYLRVQHPILGTLSGFEAFLLIGAHTRRHVGQIRELLDPVTA